MVSCWPIFRSRMPVSPGLHPSAKQIVCGDARGGVYILEMIGVDYGPLVVTAAERGMRFNIRCPARQHQFQIEKDRLGSEMICPQEGCCTQLKVNPFGIQQPAQRKRNWLSKLLKKFKNCPYRTVLGAFSRALQREAHVLTRHPELIWQQMYNRLQWEGEVANQAIAPETCSAQRLGCQAMVAD